MALNRLSHHGTWKHVELQIPDIRGFDAFDNAGIPVGIVDDLLVETDDEVSYALVGQGNISTMLSGKELLVPLDKLDIDPENEKVKLKVNLDQLWDFPTYNTLDDPGLKDEVESFWKSTELARPIRHDVTLSYPSGVVSPPPIPPEVEPSKMPAGNPRIVSGLESPVPEEVIKHALSSMAQREAAEKEKPTELKKPEAKEEKERKKRAA